jgi:hypothetical protein
VRSCWPLVSFMNPRSLLLKRRWASIRGDGRRKGGYELPRALADSR